MKSIGGGMHSWQLFSLPAFLVSFDGATADSAKFSPPRRPQAPGRRSRLFGGVCLTALALGGVDIAQAQDGPLIYVPNLSGNDVSVINTPANTVVPTTIPVGLAPLAAVVRGDQSLVYVSNGADNTVSVIDASAKTVVATIPVGTQPTIIALTPDNTRAYVTTQDNNVAVIDTATNTVVGAIPVGTRTTGVVVTPDGSRVYASSTDNNTVFVIATASNTVVATIPVGIGPQGLTVTPDGSRVYVANSTSNDITVIATATNAVVATVSAVVNPVIVAVTPDGTRAYVTNQLSNNVTVIDTSTNTVVATIAVGAQATGVVITPDGTRAYVTNLASNTVSVIDTATNAVVATLAVGDTPLIAGICSNGNALLGTGLTFRANTGGAVACTQASGPAGSPGPVFSGGTLLIEGAGVASGLPITLQAQGGIVDTNGNNATLSGPIGGPGGLSKIGAGTLTLSGQSTYTGATGVVAGTLQAGAVNAFSASSAFTVASGATLALAGFNQTIGSLAGAGAVTLGSATLTTGNDNTNTAFAGVISGTGGLTKIGNGIMTLTGANTFNGPTAVNGGILAVNGSLSGAVVVNGGGTLGGTGQVGPVTVAGGTMAPGNSIGTLTVGGGFVQNGGVYQVEVNSAGQGDRINVTGTATINGGSVQVLAQQGTYARNTTYTILNATGGVSGTYSAVTSNFAFLTPSLQYDSNNVFLTLLQSNSAFAAGAQTPNQFAVGTALDRANSTATGDFNTVLNALSGLSTTQGPAALDSIGGQPYSGFGTANLQSGLTFMNVVGQQMSLARGGIGGGGRVALAEACEAPCDAAQPSGFSVWGSALGNTGSVAGNGNSSTLTYNLGGFATGLDYRSDSRLLVGLGLGYASGNQWVGGFNGSGTTNSYSASIYASFTPGAFYIDAMAGYAYNDNKMTRQIVIPGLAPRTALGRTGADQFLGQAEVGYRFDIYAPATATVTPFARLQYTSVAQDAFTETGAASINLNVMQQTTNSVRTVIGAELQGAIDMGWRDRLALQFRVGWSHEYADVSRPVNASFAGAPAFGYTVYGATPQRDGAVIGLAANTAIAQNTSIYLRYDGEFGIGTDNHVLSAGFRMKW